MPTGIYPRKPVEERFWAKVNKDGPIPEYAPHLGACWVWQGAVSHGYGYFLRGPGFSPRAHRFAYEMAVGPIPAGLVLDHLCRVRNCVNAAHLEVVTNRINLLRGESFSALHAAKTHCARGHEFTTENTRLRLGRYGPESKERQCWICYRRRRKEKQVRRRAAQKAARK